MKQLSLLLLMLLVCGYALIFAISASDPASEEATITLQGTTVTYIGRITDRNVERFLTLVQGNKVSTLIISSGGGEVNAGMKLGEWIYDHGIDVVVERMCMSSCANYIFTAGAQKTINQDSIVAWHGNVLQESGMSDQDVRTATIKAFQGLPESRQAQLDLEVLIAQSIQQMHEYQAQSRTRQAEFFKKIGVDEYICRVGNKEYGAEDFFCLSVKDMARFGIEKVKAPDNYEQTDLAPFRRQGHSVDFIHLK